MLLIKNYINEEEIARKKCNFTIKNEHDIEMCTSEEEIKFIEELSKQNKFLIYKATFKKQSDGNYYFTKGEWQ